MTPLDMSDGDDAEQFDRLMGSVVLAGQFLGSASVPQLRRMIVELREHTPQGPHIQAAIDLIHQQLAGRAIRMDPAILAPEPPADRPGAVVPISSARSAL